MKRIKSLKGFEWHPHEVDADEVSLLSKKLDTEEIFARLLAIRKISHENAHNHLNPTLRVFMPDPFHLKDMKKATEIITQSIINKEKIIIFGDYDVDGATSSALLKRYCASLSIEVDVYIPDRIVEGYGPNIEAFKKLKSEGADLIITVDCGTASFEAIDYAKEIGLKIVVIDHHLSSDTLPQADALVNPNRYDETTEHNNIAAVGVAFLLAAALNSHLRSINYFSSINEPSLLNFLDIVAIGTICDVVPLKSLNRAFVVQGLKILNQKKNAGVKALCNLLNIEGELSTYHLGYVIGPRINAGGRVGEAKLGSLFLSTNDDEQAFAIAQKLNLYNEERKAIEQNVYELALAQAQKQIEDEVLIMVGGENWHQGVVGIIAGRLKEIFNKSIAVISYEGTKAKASCRAINGVDFGKAIVKAKEMGIILTGGGHKLAAGFTAETDKISQLRSFLKASFLEDLAKISNPLQRNFDAYISTNSINIDLINKIQQLGPFGPANPEPKFMIKNVYIVKASIFANDHITCFISSAQNKNFVKTLKANAFRVVNTPVGDFILNSSGQKCSLIGYIRINRWRNRENLEFIIEDIIPE